jgi:hypothetical protein
MARTGRPKAVLVLTDEERETLGRWARRPSIAQSLPLRAKIVLSCAEGRTKEAVASELSCNPATVSERRSRFVAKRLKGLADEQGGGVPRKVTGRPRRGRDREDRDRKAGGRHALVDTRPGQVIGDVPAHGQPEGCRNCLRVHAMRRLSDDVALAWAALAMRCPCPAKRLREYRFVGRANSRSARGLAQAAREYSWIRPPRTSRRCTGADVPRLGALRHA